MAQTVLAIFLLNAAGIAGTFVGIGAGVIVDDLIKKVKR